MMKLHGPRITGNSKKARTVKEEAKTRLKKALGITLASNMDR